MSPRTWDLTSSRPAHPQTTLTAKPCRSELALSPHAPTWRDAWTNFPTVRWNFVFSPRNPLMWKRSGCKFCMWTSAFFSFFSDGLRQLFASGIYKYFDHRRCSLFQQVNHRDETEKKDLSATQCIWSDGWQVNKTLFHPAHGIALFSGNLNDLVQHGLRALRETLPAEQDLTTKVQLSRFIYPSGFNIC